MLCSSGAFPRNRICLNAALLPGCNSGKHLYLGLAVIEIQPMVELIWDSFFGLMCTIRFVSNLADSRNKGSWPACLLKC